MKRFLVYLLLLGPGRGDLTPQGRLGAVDGAVKAASMGGSVVGICGEKFVVLVSLSEKATGLAYPIERIWRVDRSACVAAVGYARDASLAGDLAQELCHDRRTALGVGPTVSQLAESLADAVATAARESRPIGAHLVVAGFGPRGPLLCGIEPSGRLSQLRALAVGRHASAISKILRNAPEPQDLTEAKRILRDAIIKGLPSSDNDDDDSSDHVDNESSASLDLYRKLSSQLVLFSEEDYRERNEADFAWMTRPFDGTLLELRKDGLSSGPASTLCLKKTTTTEDR